MLLATFALMHKITRGTETAAAADWRAGSPSTENEARGDATCIPLPEMTSIV